MNEGMRRRRGGRSSEGRGSGFEKVIESILTKKKGKEGARERKIVWEGGASFWERNSPGAGEEKQSRGFGLRKKRGTPRRREEGLIISTGSRAQGRLREENSPLWVR